jgi:serine/threonine protein kinase
MKLFLNRFKILKELGQGGYGLAVLAQDEQTNTQVALKIIHKHSIKKISHINRLRREINILRLLDHPHIVKLYEVIESDSMMVLVMEYIDGGDLFEHVVQQERLSDEDGRKLFRQLLSAITYCHQNNIVHRDLKPENIMITSEGNIKVIDFGFTTSYDPENLLKTYCGSLNYCAPEMLEGVPYPGPAADIWSLGVILFVLLNGYLPYNGQNANELYSQFTMGEMEVNEYADTEALALILVMLNTQPSSRATIFEINENPWVMKGEKETPIQMTPGDSTMMTLKKDLLLQMKEMENLSHDLSKSFTAHSLVMNLECLKLPEDSAYSSPMNQSSEPARHGIFPLEIGAKISKAALEREFMGNTQTELPIINDSLNEKEFDSCPVSVQEQPKGLQKIFNIFRRKHVVMNEEGMQ